MCRNKVLALIAVLCFVFPVAIAEAGNPKGNSGNGEGSANSNYLNGKPFSALAEAISINFQTIDQLQSEIKEIKFGLSEMADNFNELKLRVSANEDGILAFESKANELDSALAEKMDTLAGLESALAGLQDDIAANQDDVQSLEAEIAQLRSEIEANLAEMGKLLTELRQELDVQKAGLDTFKEEFAQYRAASDLVITRLQNEMTNAICDIAATETVSGENLAAILLLQEAMNNINSDLISLNSSYITLSERFIGHTHMYYDRWHLIYGSIRVTARSE